MHQANDGLRPLAVLRGSLAIHLRVNGDPAAIHCAIASGGGGGGSVRWKCDSSNIQTRFKCDSIAIQTRCNCDAIAIQLPFNCDSSATQLRLDLRLILRLKCDVIAMHLRSSCDRVVIQLRPNGDSSDSLATHWRFNCDSLRSGGPLFRGCALRAKLHAHAGGRPYLRSCGHQGLRGCPLCAAAVVDDRDERLGPRVQLLPAEKQVGPPEGYKPKVELVLADLFAKDLFETYCPPVQDWRKEETERVLVPVAAPAGSASANPSTPATPATPMTSPRAARSSPSEGPLSKADATKLRSMLNRMKSGVA
eukprot:13645633-Alexandrium_andersonii.AAC.1